MDARFQRFRRVRTMKSDNPSSLCVRSTLVAHLSRCVCRRRYGRHLFFLGRPCVVVYAPYAHIRPAGGHLLSADLKALSQGNRAVQREA